MMGRRGIPKRVEGEPGIAKRVRGDEGIMRGEVRAKSRSGLKVGSLGSGRRRWAGMEGVVRAGSGSCRSSKSGKAAAPPLFPIVSPAVPSTLSINISAAPPIPLISLPFISPHNYLLINLSRGFPAAVSPGRVVLSSGPDLESPEAYQPESSNAFTAMEGRTNLGTKRVENRNTGGWCFRVGCWSW